MKFGALQRRVKRCEQVVTVRLGETRTTGPRSARSGDRAGRRCASWWSAWPVASSPASWKCRARSTARWLQMVGSVSNLFASAQAAFATAMAAQAAATADDAAEEADDASEQAQAAASAAEHGRHRPPCRSQNRTGARPRPAEAATELSER
jgi:hypothetical protein